MIKETVNGSHFTDVLLADEYASWSYGATKALFDYYDQLSEDIGEDIELDRVAIRCEWTEYDSARECASDYGYTPNLNAHLSDDDIEADAREWLEERTTVLDVENTDFANHCKIKSILVMQF